MAQEGERPQSKKRFQFTLFLSLLLIFALIPLSLFADHMYLLSYKKAVDLKYVTDPSNPDFKLESFDSSHYAFQDDLTAALRKMFPLGSTSEDVEKAFSHVKKVEKVYTKYSEEKNEMRVLYRFPKTLGLLPNLKFCLVEEPYWSFIFIFEISETQRRKTYSLKTIVASNSC